MWFSFPSFCRKNISLVMNNTTLFPFVKYHKYLPYPMQLPVRTPLLLMEYRFFNSNGLFPSKFIWAADILSKVQCFEWLGAYGRSNSCDATKEKTILVLSPNWCVLCKGKEEYLHHLLLHCQYSYFLWCEVFREFGVQMALLRRGWFPTLGSKPWGRSLERKMLCWLWFG